MIVRVRIEVTDEERGTIARSLGHEGLATPEQVESYARMAFNDAYNEDLENLRMADQYEKEHPE